MSASPPLPGSRRAAAQAHHTTIGPFFVRLGHRVLLGHNREPDAPNDRQPALDPGRPGGQAGLPGRRSRGESPRALANARGTGHPAWPDPAFLPATPRQSPTLTSGASPLPPQTQRTFAAAAADDDAHAVSDTPESKPRFTPSTATRRALFGTPSSDHRPISRHRRSPR